MSTWPELHSGTNFNYIWDTGTLVWIKQVSVAPGPVGDVNVTNVGQAAMAASIPVVIASDQSAITTIPSGTQVVKPATVVNSGVISGGSSFVGADATGCDLLRVLITANTCTGGSVLVQGSVDNTNWANLPDTLSSGSTSFGSAAFYPVGTEATYKVGAYIYVRAITIGGLTGGTMTLTLHVSRVSYPIGIGTEYTANAILSAVTSTSAAGISSNETLAQLAYTTALDYDASNNPIYVGRAVQGSAKSAAVWQIRKFTFDGSNNATDMQFANASLNYNAIWNNRASLSYS